MTPSTDVSREAMDALADAIFGSPAPDEVPTPERPDDLPDGDHVDGLATACLRVWADGGDDAAR
jgi:hypothetical protein